MATDGKLDEAAWQRATPIKDFRQYQPTEGAAASLPMEVRVLYDDAAIYIGARCAEPNPASILTEALPRDHANVFRRHHLSDNRQSGGCARFTEDFQSLSSHPLE